MPKKIADEKVRLIEGLIDAGHSYESISRITNSSKTTIGKICKSRQTPYPPIRIPEGMRETEYPGYYITEDGKAYRTPGKYDKNAQNGTINEYGLIYLKPGFRGHAKYPEHQYECVNISIYDENGRFARQIKRSIHQLVAVAFVPNPEGYQEIDHIDRNKRNNHYTNLRWIGRFDNASEPNEKYYKITDTLSGTQWEGYNLRTWVKDNYDFLIQRKKKKNSTIIQIASNLSSARSKKTKIWGLIVE
jgi:hypothetical protein